jgi:hypothetical protein
MRLHLTAARAFRSVLAVTSCIFSALHLPSPAAVGEARRWATMRLTLPFVFLLFGGCAVLFTEGDRELGVIQPQPATNVVIRAVLPRDARSIRFTSATPIPSGQGEQRVTVTLVNTSTRTIELGPGAVSTVAPHSSVQFFDGSLSALVGDRGFVVSTLSGRASCELHILFASAPSLPAPIRVLCWRSSPPL